jgi:GH35 family endo-1,4-beta-xylanase
VDWDVVNEPYSNHDFMDILGNAEMVEWFKLARAADPKVKLYINDYGVLESGLANNRHADHYFKTIQYLIDQGAPLDGIGFQGHVGSRLTAPADLLAVLDKFSVFDKRFKITELDINLDNEDDLRADYMRDFMTVCFSHDRVDGILHWGFWAGRHWIPQAALFDKEWNLRPHGKAYEDLVFKTWWTDQSVRSDARGEATVRGFLGDYDVLVEGRSVPAVLKRDGTTIVIK